MLLLWEVKYFEQEKPAGKQLLLANTCTALCAHASLKEIEGIAKFASMIVPRAYLDLLLEGLMQKALEGQSIQ